MVGDSDFQVVRCCSFSNRLIAEIGRSDLVVEYCACHVTLTQVTQPSVLICIVVLTYQLLTVA